jgi:hypothetical protein
MIYNSNILSRNLLYSDIFNRFHNHSKEYISIKIDHLYNTNYINDEIYISSWCIFIRNEVIHKVNDMINNDLCKAKLRLLIMKCLHNRDDCNIDIIKEISL